MDDQETEFISKIRSNRKPILLKDRHWLASELDILFSLYVHRSLTVVQLSRVAGLYYKGNSFSNKLNKMKEKGLLLVKTEEMFSGSTKYYSLAKKGMDVVLKGLEIDSTAKAEERKHKKDKMYYRLDDLVIGQQVAHHYYIQDWVTRLLQKFLWSEYYFFPNCEWRRYPFFNALGEVPYRPDWLIFFPDEHFEYIMLRQDYKWNPLHFPYKFRQTTQWDIQLRPMFMLECDMGGMDLERLRQKWRLIRENRDYIGKTLVAFSPIKRINPKGEILKLNKRKRSRIKSIRKSLLEVLERVMCEDVLRVFVGDEHQSVQACELFIENHYYYRRKLELSWDQLLRGTNHLANAPELLYEANRVETKHLDPKPEEYIICRKEDDTIFEVQFIFKCALGWLNPYAKIQRLKKCMKYSTMMPVKYILIYPDEQQLRVDTISPDTGIYYVLLNEINEIGWVNAYQLIRVHGKPVWYRRNVFLEQNKQG